MSMHCSMHWQALRAKCRCWVIALAQTFGDNPVFEALSFNTANDMFDQLTTTHMELSAATGHHG